MLTTQGAGLRVGPIPLPPPPIHIEAIGQNVVASLPVSQDDLDIAMALIELTVPL